MGEAQGAGGGDRNRLEPLTLSDIEQEIDDALKGVAPTIEASDLLARPTQGVEVVPADHLTHKMMLD